MHGFPTPSSGGAPNRGPGAAAANKSGMAGRMPGMGPGGSVAISGPEERALRVVELDPEDDAETYQRAAAESGLSPQSVMQLVKRAQSARDKGYTLKGPSISFPPNGQPQPDGLLGADPATAGTVPPAGGAADMGMGGMGGGKPSVASAMSGGPMVGGATMSSAGLTGQRAAAPWRPQMSQATAAPARMTPDVDTSGAGKAPTRPGPSAISTGGSRGIGGFSRANTRDPKLAAAYARESGAVEECGCDGKGKKASRKPLRSMWGG